MNINEKYLYEYDEPLEELEGINANYIRVPREIIRANFSKNNRIAVYTYLHMYKGLNNKICFCIPMFLKWAGYKSDSHCGGINDKVIDTLHDLEILGYVVLPTKYNLLSRTECFEISFNANKLSEECMNNSFAILYLDEVEKIMQFRNENIKDTHLNNMTVLLVFAFLRDVIFRRPNKLKPENRSENGLEALRKARPEAYADHCKGIGEDLGVSERAVSKAVKVLERLHLIVVDEAYRVKNEKGEFKTGSYSV